MLKCLSLQQVCEQRGPFYNSSFATQFIALAWERSGFSTGLTDRVSIYDRYIMIYDVGQNVWGKYVHAVLYDAIQCCSCTFLQYNRSSRKIHGNYENKVIEGWNWELIFKIDELCRILNNLWWRVANIIKERLYIGGYLRHCCVIFLLTLLHLLSSWGGIYNLYVDC